MKALDGVSLTIQAGQVHALCGENGAGKSTLMHIISGSLQPDNGKILLHGKPVVFNNVQDARAQGIAIVYQERTLAPALTVAENIFPVSPILNRLGLIDLAAVRAATIALLAELGVSGIVPDTIVDLLSPAAQQLVEIAKALASEPKLLVLDEPTASLNEPEALRLSEVIRKLRDRGTAIIYISHRMHEIIRIADIISVLRDGKYQGSFESYSVTIPQLIYRMVGRELSDRSYTSNAQTKILLSVNSFSGVSFTDVSFDLYEGEIVGIAGLEGSGRSKLVRTLFGDYKRSGGNVTVAGKPLSPSHPADAVEAGIAYLPENRKELGLFADQDIASNIVVNEAGITWYDRSNDIARANHLRSLVNITCSSVTQSVAELSGGNQQKVLLARWMNRDPRILIVNEPTHGVDVGARSAIYDEFKKLTASGKSILMVSSDLPELLLLCDRIIVMCKGRQQAILTRHEFSEEKITALAMGVPV